MKKYGFRTNKNNFERYYLRQLKSFMKATNLFTDITHLTEESSIEDISKTFDTLIDFLEVVNRNKRDYVVARGLCSDSHKYPTFEKVKSILEKELEEFFTMDIQNLHYKYKKLQKEPKTVEDVRNVSAYEELKDLEIIPIDTNKITTENKILVMDINYLPAECKNSSTEEERNRMEEIYKCKVLFIDTSRQNTQGMQVSHPPVFFI